MAQAKKKPRPKFKPRLIKVKLSRLGLPPAKKK